MLVLVAVALHHAYDPPRADNCEKHNPEPEQDSNRWDYRANCDHPDGNNHDIKEHYIWWLHHTPLSPNLSVRFEP